MPFATLPAVLSFQRCLLVSDALFYNLFENEDKSIFTTPLHVIRHGIRATQNVANDGKAGQSAAATVDERDARNLQVTDTAKLAPKSLGLRVRFQLRFLDIRKALFACAFGKQNKKKAGTNEGAKDPSEFRSAWEGFIKQATEPEACAGLLELARRYARNLANGRWLWRNLDTAAHVLVRIVPEGEQPLTFNALDISLNSFANYSDDEKKIAAYIAKGLCGARDATLTIEADVDFGVRGALEVFPSQNYLWKQKNEDRKNGNRNGNQARVARSLYCVGNAPENQEEHSIQKLGQAALRDQKISNAIRTIDTWYPTFVERKIPIPVEPKGANLDAQDFFRNDEKSSGFKIMRRIDVLDHDSEEGMFLLACVIRGGVFSDKAEEGKEE